jgi:hypothetical protein
MNARFTREGAVLHDMAGAIKNLRAFELYSGWHQAIEDSNVLEHFDGIVLDEDARPDFSDFRRPLVHSNGPSLLGQHQSGAQTPNASTGYFRMAVHVVTRLLGAGSGASTAREDSGASSAAT